MPSLRFRGILGAMVGNELWDTMMRFHREIAMPEIIGELSDRIGSLRREMLSGFDAVYQRLDRQLANERRDGSAGAKTQR